MSRKLRAWFRGAVYHITARGNRRAKIFVDQKDYLMYLYFLEEVRKLFPFVLHSYCLMTNHLHLQIETQEHHIQDIMKKLHTDYAIYFNKRHELDGHVFQGRYGSRLILSIKYFLDVSRYIHLNPLEANIVKKPEDYRWSSYSSYLNLSKNPHIVTTKTLSYIYESSFKTYKQFVEETREGEI